MQSVDCIVLAYSKRNEGKLQASLYPKCSSTFDKEKLKIPAGKEVGNPFDPENCQGEN